MAPMRCGIDGSWTTPPEIAGCVAADGPCAAALRQVQARLQAIFEGVETGIFLIDPREHRIVDANPVALELVGATREQVVGAVCHKFVCPAETGKCPVTDLGQNVDNSERVLLTATGQRCAIIKTVRPVSVEGQPLLLESFLDITERREAEQNLVERTAYLNILIEASLSALRFSISRAASTCRIPPWSGSFSIRAKR